MAATALTLALSSTEGPVILAGLDLCFLDLHGHARPGTFQRLRLTSARRTDPFEHQAFLSALQQAPRRLAPGPGPARSGLALDTYAGWFASLPAPHSGRLHRLNPSPVALPSLRSLDAKELRELLDDAAAAEKPNRQALPPWPNPPDRSVRLQRPSSDRACARRTCAAFLFASSRRGGPIEFLQDVPLARLAYHFDAASMAEIRRLRRLHGEREAAARAEELLERLSRFLARLEGRLEEVDA